MYAQDILCGITKVPLKFHTKYLAHTIDERCVFFSEFKI